MRSKKKCGIIRIYSKRYTLTRLWVSPSKRETCLAGKVTEGRWYPSCLDDYVTFSNRRCCKRQCYIRPNRHERTKQAGTTRRLYSMSGKWIVSAVGAIRQSLIGSAKKPERVSSHRMRKRTLSWVLFLIHYHNVLCVWKVSTNKCENCWPVIQFEV